jgi:ribosomal silencing factor RsfS
MMNAEEIKTIALKALDDLKARDIVTLDVRGLTGVLARPAAT